MALGKNVARIRKEQGLSQSDLVIMIQQRLPEDQHDKIQGAISNIERRDSAYSKYIGELEIALQTPMRDLLLGEFTPKDSTRLNRSDSCAIQLVLPIGFDQEVDITTQKLQNLLYDFLALSDKHQQAVIEIAAGYKKLS